MSHEGVRAKKRFLADFTLAYDPPSRRCLRMGTEKAEEEKEEQAEEDGKENTKKPGRPLLLQLPQKDAEATLATEIDARLVCLTAD